MFNDFKLLTFDVVKQKILKLKDIFDRLNLSNLEKRLIELENSLFINNNLNLQFGLCDLIVENITMEITILPEWINNQPIPALGKVKITITIKNIGTEESPDNVYSILSIYGDGGVSGVIDGGSYGTGGLFIPAIKPNKTVELYQNFEWNPYTLDNYVYAWLHLNWNGAIWSNTLPTYPPLVANPNFPIPIEIKYKNFINEKSFDNNTFLSSIKLIHWNELPNFPIQTGTYFRPLGYGVPGADFCTFKVDNSYYLATNNAPPGFQNYEISPGNHYVIAYNPSPGPDIILGMINFPENQTTELIAMFSYS